MPLSAITATWPLLLGMGVLMLGAGLQSTLLGLRATLEGFPAPVIGIVMSCYYIGYVLGTIIAPYLLRQVGHIRVFAALAAVASVAILIQGGFVNPAAWGAMRLISGMCFAGIYVVAESWINDRASRAESRPIVRRVHAGAVRRSWRRTVPADPVEPIDAASRSCWCRC